MEFSTISHNENSVYSCVRNIPKFYLKGLMLAMLVALFNFGSILGQVNPNQQSQQERTAATPMEQQVIVDQVIGNPYYTETGIKSLGLRGDTPAPNPDLPADIACGDIKIVLILDESGSITEDQSPGAAAAVRSGASQLAQSLLNSGAELTVIEFATESTVLNLGGNAVNGSF